jgi:hypothetical protein
LENLVGSRDGEPTLRVTAALAWLLEDDPGNRRTRQTALKKLYNLRSDVVHGNRPLDGAEAVQGSRDARAVAVDALRKLFRDRPELLRECGDGSEWGLRLMLGKASVCLIRFDGEDPAGHYAQLMTVAQSIGFTVEDHEFGG